jgi:hypothetical protein
VYLPGIEAGTLRITLDALDGAGQVIGTSAGSVGVRAGDAVGLTLTLDPVTPPSPDLSTPAEDLSVDMAGDGGFLGGASRCAALVNQVKFCEGFETPLSNWTLTPAPGGQIVEDGTQVARGAQALHVADPGQISDAMAVTRDFSAVPPGFTFAPMYVRFFVSYDPPVSGLGAILMTISSGSGYLAIRSSDDAHVELDVVGLGTDYARVSTTPFPRGRWGCFELSGVPGGDGGVDGTLRLSLDDVPLADVVLGGVDMSNPLGGLTLGFAINYGSVVPKADVWFDELIVDDKPIGCAK